MIKVISIKLLLLLLLLLTWNGDELLLKLPIKLMIQFSFDSLSGELKNVLRMLCIKVTK